MAHTILLVQPDVNPETRTYSDYESVNECMEGVCKIYEEHLKKRNPNTPTITYDISQLFDFVDQLSDLSCLVYQNLQILTLLTIKIGSKRRYIYCYDKLQDIQMDDKISYS
ncbi:hypothetical protein HHI36_021052 [Cryptolaemus montrouzieri]|uniref:Enhancer of rudimentary homolog n=1 Tax=Cryptolaemus montrouzieri TaxID=559131 RepID=A0ABD2MW30_9CUCU